MGSEIQSQVRPLFLLPLLLCVAASPIARAAGFDEGIRDEAALTQLETRAEAAQPREQCFLYTELVHSLTELAGSQMASGKDAQASATLKHIDTLAEKIHKSLARDSKRLKDTELLMHHTTRRLADMLHITSSDNRVVLQAALKNLDGVQAELLTQVFGR